MALDADPEVVGVAAQPMLLHWTDTARGGHVGNPGRRSEQWLLRRPPVHVTYNGGQSGPKGGPLAPTCRRRT